MLNHYKKKKPSCQAKEQKSTPMQNTQNERASTLNKTSPPFLRCLDFGVCEAIRLVRFGYNTFTGCVV